MANRPCSRPTVLIDLHGRNYLAIPIVEWSVYPGGQGNGIPKRRAWRRGDDPPVT